MVLSPQMFISRVVAVIKSACVVHSIEEHATDAVVTACAKVRGMATYGAIAVLIHLGKALPASNFVTMELV